MVPPSPGSEPSICRSRSWATRSASGAGDGSGAARPKTSVAKKGRLWRYIFADICLPNRVHGAVATKAADSCWMAITFFPNLTQAAAALYAEPISHLRLKLRHYATPPSHPSPATHTSMLLALLSSSVALPHSHSKHTHTLSPAAHEKAPQTISPRSE